MYKFFDMFVGDELRNEINNIKSPSQRHFFQSALEQYENFITSNDEVLTFGEYFNMEGRT